MAKEQLIERSKPGMVQTTRMDANDTAAPSACRRLPDKGILLGLLAAWVALFHFLGASTLGYVDTPSLFGWWFWVNTRGLEGSHGLEVLDRILGSDEAHVWIMPFVVLGLFHWKRKELLDLPKRIWWPALGLFGAALSLHVVGYMVQQSRVSLMAFFLGAYALTGLVWGRQWLRATFFPYFLFLFCIPVGNFAETITFPLRLWASKITVLLVHGVLGVGVMQNGTSLWEPSGRFQYEVAAACSGIRSLTAIFALALIYGFIDFKKAWHRFLLAAAAFPLALIGNVVRLSVIIVAAEMFGQSGGNYVHENFWFSLLPYAPAFITLALLGHWLRKGALHPAQPLEVKAT